MLLLFGKTNCIVSCNGSKSISLCLGACKGRVVGNSNSVSWSSWQRNRCVYRQHCSRHGKSNYTSSEASSDSAHWCQHKLNCRNRAYAVFYSEVDAYVGEWNIQESGVIGRNPQDTLLNFYRCTLLDLILEDSQLSILCIPTYLIETCGCVIAPFST